MESNFVIPPPRPPVAIHQLKATMKLPHMLPCLEGKL
ncbi:hypothetical protein CCACVL1_03598 [Corchorus capsularis]|uniref:Uncharacterized protein n=1 Tax=Corchorus capsularis TaxID=210143 RepID=A0A1R3JY92_COCAP|nr:hypothetical protein CCACVL1_03598 [Corchorus capsularis]